VIGGELGALFRSPARGKWEPKAGGALVDAGSTPAGGIPATDLAGAGRVFGKAIDIGCLESHQNFATLLFVK
jgi:hypothetical protein